MNRPFESPYAEEPCSQQSFLDEQERDFFDMQRNQDQENTDRFID